MVQSKFFWCVDARGQQIDRSNLELHDISTSARLGRNGACPCYLIGGPGNRGGKLAEKEHQLILVAIVRKLRTDRDT